MDSKGGGYVDSPDWKKRKKAATILSISINPINRKDNKCFQYSETVMLNQEETIKHLQRITKIKSFINEYNWKGTNYPSEKGDWKIFEKNNLTVAINVLYSKKEITYSAYVSKHNSNREKQFILLMISKGGIIQKK